VVPLPDVLVRRNLTGFGEFPRALVPGQEQLAS
jgi:hypothetical protein